MASGSAGCSPWDVAAGAVLVREAGGFVTEIDGGDFMKTGAMIAANNALLPHLTKAVRGAEARSPACGEARGRT